MTQKWFIKEGIFPKSFDMFVWTSGFQKSLARNPVTTARPWAFDGFGTAPIRISFYDGQTK